MARAQGSAAYRLANQILDVVRNARFELGHHLREQQLADLLGVSRTPVRAALQLLVNQGVVEARKNQGFFLARDFDALHRVNLEVPVSQDDTLYEMLVRDRLAGRVGQSLTQTEIAKRYGVDRLVLLRTLARMAEDGLVERNKGHGWTFLPTVESASALRSGYELRRMIEPEAFRLPGFRPDRGALERSRLKHMYLVSHPHIASVEARVLFETDAEFHEMFAEFSGNVFALQAIQQQNRLRRLLEFAGYANRRRVRDWCAEHLAIIDAVVEGNYQLAGNLMREHLSHADAAAADVPAKPAPKAARPKAKEPA
jgi:DNA-binding GntR family transcriptional regulator